MMIRGIIKINKFIMLQKIKNILGSIRFWIATLTASLAILEAISVGTITIQYVFEVAQIWLAAVVAIGTLDSVAVKFGEAKAKK